MDPYKLKFIQKTDILEEINDGYSGAILYKVIRGYNKYFLKIFNEKIDKQKIEKHLIIYEKLNINSLCIIDYDYIEEFNKFYIVYNFIEGVNLKEHTNNEDYSLDDIRKIGKNIGEELLKLKEYQDYEEDIFIQLNLENMIKEVIKNFNYMLDDKIARNTFTLYFQISELNLLTDKLNKYLKIFDYIKPGIIHGDIKRANIMVDNCENYYLVDCESMQINYDVMNFLYQITWALFEGYEREMAFISGYFDGIYYNSRPDTFNEMIEFTAILNFFKESYTMYINKNNNFISYIENCKKLFDKLNKMDLNNEFIL